MDEREKEEKLQNEEFEDNDDEYEDNDDEYINSKENNDVGEDDDDVNNEMFGEDEPILVDKEEDEKVEFNKEDIRKFRFDASKKNKNNEKIKRNIKKEKRKTRFEVFKLKLKNNLLLNENSGSWKFASRFSMLLDFLLNAFTIVCMCLSIYWAIKYIIGGDIYMSLVAAGVALIISYINKSIE